MPRTNIDYSKTIIYKIQHTEKEHLIYVGQTTDFKRRKSQHKKLALCDHPTWKDSNVKVYKMIRENGGWEMFKMIQIKEFSCSNRREAEAEEFKIMQELKATMNSVMTFTGITLDKSYECSKAYSKAWDERNREKIREAQKERDLINSTYKQMF